ncbi:MAG: phosphoenolpyruvate carboxylase [Methanomicrobiales archaeon HGW-Methanomicrobiales-2]|nr:MAG: phosphoenolpyruvate carboxylase [Methanomicrobiales archaeon HGW-Methanomicrobiales-2]
MVRIPQCMSTQHPDNVNLPFFAESPELGGEDEVQEAYYAYSHLGCSEQMWDCEGKEVDNFVVRKLLTRYDTFFREKQLGRDVFLTMRVPNPEIETAEAKILLETLESIPRSFDTACLFYGEECPPIYEVILPMTASHTAVDNIYRYYTDIVVGKQERRLGEGSKTIADWIGRFRPDRINVIPLFEEMDHMLDAHNVVRRYLEGKDIADQRVFLARSDPAMNYGLVSAVLLNKIALRHLREVSEETGTRIYPIIGVGSAPFRGGLSPLTVDRVTAEYPSAHTFTVQSAFKYDYPLEDVRNAVRRLEERWPTRPLPIDEEAALDLIERYTGAYERQLGPLAPLINRVARYVPERRKRKLHIGLFGYARSTGGITLPRAIKFTAALYSIGLPPEILGLDALDDADIGYIREVYVNFDEDLRAACRFLNTETGFVPSELAARVTDLTDVEPDEEHTRITAAIARALRENETGKLTSLVLQAAQRRKFLG